MPRSSDSSPQVCPVREEEGSKKDLLADFCGVSPAVTRSYVNRAGNRSPHHWVTLLNIYNRHHQPIDQILSYNFNFHITIYHYFDGKSS